MLELAPSEFWRMSPQEFWLLLDMRDHQPMVGTMKMQTFNELKAMLH